MKGTGAAHDYSIGPMQGKRVLITGGAGFLGSNLAHKLVALGAEEIVLYDAMLPEYGANPENFREIKDKVKVVKGDTRDFETLAKNVKGKDLIFNYAAQVSHVRSMREPLLDIEINCTGNMNVLEACRKFNDSAKVIFSGTRTQIGEAQYTPIDEKHPINPVDIVGANKQAAQWYHQLYYKVHGIRTSTIVLNNTYGPRHQVRNPDYGIVNWFVRLAIEGKEIELFGDGSQTRDFNYVDDVNDAALLAAQSDKSNGEAYLLGSGEEISMLEAAKIIIKAAGSGSYKLKPFPKERAKIDVKRFLVSYEKIKNDIGWFPKTNFEKGIAKTVEFYRQRLQHYR
ncbi:GDP-L-fucose synthase [Candidatus Gugararchaeum adminiculabundum]|nr:GDP-L-fucose synthase [Candidatus Gugararchaeum adminiculabundum]